MLIDSFDFNVYSFQMKFPSGSFVEFRAFTYDGSQFGNIIVQIPSDDFNCTIGLCGSFDDNPLNDMKDRFGKEHTSTLHSPAPSTFTESWRYDI